MRRTASHPKPSDETLQLVASQFKALSEPTRLKLLCALRDGPKSVSELVELTRTGQPNVSRQLQVLVDAGILDRQKQGVSVIYTVADPRVFGVCEQFCSRVRERLEQRVKASAWFAK